MPLQCIVFSGSTYSQSAIGFLHDDVTYVWTRLFYGIRQIISPYIYIGKLRVVLLFVSIVGALYCMQGPRYMNGMLMKFPTR